MIKVTEVGEVGAYVVLLEYANVEGMLPFTELVRGRVRSIRKLVSVGQQQVVLVTHVDHERHRINLSKRQVHAADVPTFRETYKRSRQMHALLATVALRAGTTVETLNENLAWPLARKHGTLHAGLRAAYRNQNVLTGLSVSVVQQLMEELALYFQPRHVKVTSVVNVTCFSYAGIEGIKAALCAAIAVSPRLDVTLLASPGYTFEVDGTDDGIEASKHIIVQAIEAAKIELKKHGGELLVQQEPNVGRGTSHTEE